VDDETVQADTLLFRRIRPDQLVHDLNENRFRPSSQLFRSVETSIYLQDTLEEHRLKTSDVVIEYAGYSIGGLAASKGREEGQAIVREPRKELPRHVCDAAHGLLAGRKPNKVGRRLAKATEVVVLGDTSKAMIDD